MFHRSISSRPPRTERCIVCVETFPTAQVIRLDCLHHFCKPCLQEHFDFSTSSLLDYPPKCCGRILYPHDYLLILKGETILECIKLSKMQREATRIACASPVCPGPDIDPITIYNDWALCERCLGLTCVRCRQSESAHLAPVPVTNTDSTTALSTYPNPNTNTGTRTLTIPATIDTSTIPIPIQRASATTRTCPPPIIDRALEATATENNWRRCPACNALVERIDGCPAMKSICEESFCYVCGRSLSKLVDEGGCLCGLRDYL